MTPDIAKEVRSFLVDVLNEMRTTYPAYKGMKYYFGLKCNLCSEETTRCLRHEEEACSDEDCVHLLRVEDLENGKVTCYLNICGEKDFFDVHKSAWIQQRGKNDVTLMQDSMYVCERHFGFVFFEGGCRFFS